LLLGSSLRLASQLDRNLALEDEFAGELGNGLLGFFCSGEVDKGVANGTGGTRVGGDRSGLARARY